MDLSGISDIHIHARGGAPDMAHSLVFPGPRPPQVGEAAFITRLFEACLAIERKDFLVEVDGTFFRGYRDEYAIDGLWFRLRRMADEPPTLDTLPSPLPAHIRQALLSPDISRGGLIYVCGGPGSGKTTTASATVVSRLLKFGGIAYTVEDPPELPLNGRHGNGYCTQTMVAGDSGRDWVESMRGVLRSQPVGANLMLFVGEIRDQEAGRIMLRAASNGFLVICTAFGSDIISSVDSFYHLLGPDQAGTLANILRLVVYQDLSQGRFTAEMLASDGPASRVAAIIRNRTITQLKDEILYQRNRMLRAG